MASTPDLTEVVTRDPYTGEEVFRAPSATSEQIKSVVEAACEAGERWAGTDHAVRTRALLEFADRLDADRDVLAKLIVREVGKRRQDADAEVAWTVLSARWYAHHPPATEIAGAARVFRRPLGVIAVVTPWNVPLITPAWKWLPALMAGNAILWKPSELASAVATAAHERMLASGVPPNAFGLLLGGPATARAICADERVSGIHFTGSESAGRTLAQLAAPRFARCALEMSGLNPAIVLADADLDLAAECIVACGTALAGQKCTATRRVFSVDAVHNELVERLSRRIKSLRLGDPRHPATDVGPLITSAARDNADAALARSLHNGATLIARSPEVAGATLFAPVLLGALASDDPLRTNELFAPLITVESCPSAEDAFSAATNSPFGLSAALYGRDPALLRVAAERIKTGVLNVNRRGDDVDLEAPFSGRRRSGNGRPEGGMYVYDTVTDVQALYM